MSDTVTLLLLKVTVLLAAALLAAHALRRAPAVRRHRTWSMAFVALLALPLLAPVMPALRVPVASWPAAGEALPNAPPIEDRATDVGTLERTGAPAPLPAVEPSSATAPGVGAARISLPSRMAVLMGIWLAGAVASLVALLIALARVGRMSAGGRALDSAEWRSMVRRISERLGVRRTVRVLAAEAVTTPMAGGIVRPTVYLPLDAATWDAERREIVLTHEIAHLASRDPLRKLVARVACTLYWFHPLVWLARRQATTDCEHACDETVLALGVRPSTYARVLLDFADAAPLRVGGAMVPIVRRAHLEERLMAILHPSSRPAKARVGIFPLLAIGALTVTLAAARPVNSVAVPVAVTEVTATPESPRVSEESRAISESAAHVARAADPAPSASLVLAAEPCWDSAADGRSFSGSLSMSGTTIHEQIGWRGSDRVIQTRLDDLRLCMITEGFDTDRDAPPSQWIARADRVILETQRSNDVRQMAIAGNDVTWTVGGQARPVDAAAHAWRAALLAVLDPIWELAQLRGAASTLRGEISTIRGERSTLRGEISTLRGHVSTLRGEISTLRGHVSTLRGEISTIRGHESTLRGMISTERGAISSLRASRRYDSDDVAARIRRHEDEIRRIEAEITRYDAAARVRAVERELAAFDVESKVAELEKEIRDFDLAGRTAAIERQIADLDVERRIQAIENEIEALDVPGRSRELEQRRDAAAARLRDLLR